MIFLGYAGEQIGKGETVMTLAGWKVLIVSVLVAVFGALQALDWTALIPDKQIDGWVICGIGVVMGGLRYFTVSPSALTPSKLVERLQRMQNRG